MIARGNPRAENRTASPLALMAALVVTATQAVGCAGGASTGAPLSADPMLHLTDHVAAATASTPGAPLSARQEMRWSFDEGIGEWRSVSTVDAARLAEVELEPVPDALRLTLRSSVQQAGAFLVGGLMLPLPDLRFADWQAILVEARTTDTFFGITAAYNLAGERGLPDQMAFFFSMDEAPPLFNDGSTQVYSLPLAVHAGQEPPAELRNIALFAAGMGDASLDVLSVALVPRGSAYLEDVGVRSVALAGNTREALYSHTPAEISYPVIVPTGGRLDLGLGALRDETVRYEVVVRSGGEETIVLPAVESSDATWKQQTADLSAFAGRTVDLVLRAESARDGAVALWGAPIVSGAEASSRPNVVFYVIDGGGADQMSVYGYNRRTTPFLERLAQRGAVFERAHSNATWTQPSTASFMTSLQHSVLGGLRRGSHSTPVPAAATTMAQHMRRGGYATASFTSNPNAGGVIGLQRGVDVFRDTEEGSHALSSAALHERLWSFRSDYPVSPYWVHFQTTDVHEPNEPESLYAGLYVTPEEREQIEAWEQQLFMAAGEDFGTTSITDFYLTALDKAGIDRRSFFAIRRGLYDETMAYQDAQLERFVRRLQADGTWDNTLLVIGADHGHPAGTFARWGRGLIEPQPEPWQGALFDSFATHVPLIVVWPDRIAGGQRFSQPVSMIDVLPTILDLVGLPAPEVMQGQSLAPMLLGDRSFEPRPVILDEFRVTDGGMIGNLEVVDGRWGASLEIRPGTGLDTELLGRHEAPAGGRWGMVHPYFPEVPSLLLYDLWDDPFALRAVNDQYPDLVKHYRAVLLEHWQANQALAQRFASADDVVLDPEQLEQLRALGYIR